MTAVEHEPGWTVAVGRRPSSSDGTAASRRGFWARPALREFALLAAVYELYTLTRRVTAGGADDAVANARAALRAEHAVGLAPERWLNHAVSTRPFLAVPADYAYATLHYVVTLARRAEYRKPLPGRRRRGSDRPARGLRHRSYRGSPRLAQTGSSATDRNPMTVNAISPSLPRHSEALLDESAPPDGTLLHISGWRLRQRVQPNGRAVIEISDETDDLIGLITSTHLPILSVDAAWRGRAHLADGTRQWWALAIGHAPTGDDEPAVTFTRRLGARGNPRRTVVRPSRLQGLWIAAAPGLHTTVTCRQGPEHRIRRLAPVPRFHADA